MAASEPASSEAELANREMDEKSGIHESDPSGKIPHDPDSLADQVQREKPEEDEKKDRLGLHRGPPNLEQNYWTNFPIKEEDKEQMAETPVESDEEEPPYPFGDAQLIYAFYANDKKTIIQFFLRMPDDKVDTHRIDPNPIHEGAWPWIRKTFTEDQLSENTQREINKINRLKDMEDEARKEAERKGKQEELFQSKLDAFEIDSVSNSKHRELKSQIRKSKTVMEVNATVGALIALEYLDGKA